jgi:hypothetical protein
MSREINSVATKPISNSISPSLDGDLAGWLNVTWLAGGEAGTAIYTWKRWRRVTIGLKITRRSCCMVIAGQ